MAEKRKSPRRKMVLSVKVAIDKGVHLAHTLDITNAGARLGALRTQLQPGMIVRLQRGSKKAKFKVTWVRRLTVTELQAGVEALEPLNNFWGVDLSHSEDENEKVLSALVTCSSGPKTSM